MRVKGGYSLSQKRIAPFQSPPRKVLDWQSQSRMTFLPPEWKCLRAAMPRLELLYDLPLLLSAHLVEVQTNLLLPTMHTVSIMRTAASEAMPLRQAIPGLIESEVERSYVRVMNRRQSDSEDRSKSNRLDIKQGRHLIRQALQFFELLACNGGVKGQGPLRSLGGPRGIFSHVREYPPFPVQRLRRCFPPPRNARKNIKKSTLTGALFQIAEN